MAASYWRTKAFGVIASVSELWMHRHDFPSGGWALLTADDRQELLKAIDAAYPFGERARHPYKCWLKERGEFVKLLEYRPAPKPARIDDAPHFTKSERAVGVEPDQLTLFEDA